MAVIKKQNSPPAFHPLPPDDGEVVVEQPTFTWSAAKDAESYTFKLAKDRQLKDVVHTKSDLRKRAILSILSCLLGNAISGQCWLKTHMA